MYFWLQEDGYIFLHVFDRTKLNPGPQNFSQCYKNKEDELVCHTYYDTMVHLSSFIPVKEENEKVYYKEKIQLLGDRSDELKMEVEMEHALWIPSRETIQKEWEYNGFRLIQEISYESEWIPDIQLVILQKPKIKVNKIEI
jgi:hypothetical protein